MDYIEDMFDDIENASVTDTMLFVVAIFIVLLILFLVVRLIIGIIDSNEKNKPINKGFVRVVDKDDHSAASFGVHYITFEFESGERVKLSADARNKLVVGDYGELTWQGNRILNFVRQNS